MPGCMLTDLDFVAHVKWLEDYIRRFAPSDCNRHDSDLDAGARFGSKAPVDAYVRSTRCSGPIACGTSSPSGQRATWRTRAKQSWHLAGIDTSRLVRKPNRWSSRHSRILHGILQFSTLREGLRSFNRGKLVSYCDVIGIFDCSVDSLGCYALRLLNRSKVVVCLPPGLVVGNRVSDKL